jgi:hypothetical protein
MSSWLFSIAGRVSLLLVPTLGCTREPAPAVERKVEVALPSAPPTPAVLPWYQGRWLGASAAPITANLTIDASGGAVGSTSLDLELRGVVDGEVVRLEASGPGGHGAVVLSRTAGKLRGVLHYAATGADQGKSALLELTRAELP